MLKMLKTSTGEGEVENEIGIGTKRNLKSQVLCSSHICRVSSLFLSLFIS